MQAQARVAVVGAGVIGLMTALSCARSGAHVDLYDMHEIPNVNGISYDHARLFRIVHESNAPLEELAMLSRSHWLDVQARLGEAVVKPGKVLRAVDANGSEKLQQHYRQRAMTHALCDRVERETLTRLYQLPESALLFVGFDALILDSKRIIADLFDQVRGQASITLFPATQIASVALDDSRLHTQDGQTCAYDGIVMATAAPVDGCMSESDMDRPIKKYQYYINLHLNLQQRQHGFLPVLHFGDEYRSWSVPSPDNSVIKISASDFSFADAPQEDVFAHLNQLLLRNFSAEYQKMTSGFASYFEHTAKNRSEMSYWRRKSGANVVYLDACDASLFKAAPAIAAQMAHSILGG